MDFKWPISDTPMKLIFYSDIVTLNPSTTFKVVSVLPAQNLVSHLLRLYVESDRQPQVNNNQLFICNQLELARHFQDYFMKHSGIKSDMHKITPTDICLVNIKVSWWCHASTHYWQLYSLFSSLQPEAINLNNFQWATVHCPHISVLLISEMCRSSFFIDNCKWACMLPPCTIHTGLILTSITRWRNISIISV